MTSTQTTATDAKKADLEIELIEEGEKKTGDVKKDAQEEFVSNVRKGDLMEIKDIHEPNTKIPFSLVTTIGFDWIWQLIGMVFVSMKIIS